MKEEIIKCELRSIFPDLNEEITTENVNTIKIGESKGFLINTVILSERLDLLDYLISIGADINIVDSNNETPLTYSLRQNNIDILKKLLDNHADPNDIPGIHHTIGIASSSKNALNYIKLLLEYGANINFDNGNMKSCPIYLVIKYSYKQPKFSYQIMKFLFENGLDLSKSNYPWIGYLISKTRVNLRNYIISLKMIKLFLEYCTDSNIPNNIGQTPMDLTSQDSESLLLIISGANVREKDIIKFIKNNRLRTLNYILENNLVNVYTKTLYNGYLQSYLDIGLQSINTSIIDLFADYGEIHLFQ